MLIFDRFPDIRRAESFAAAAQALTKQPSIVCRTQDEFDAHDVFPWELDFPVVLVPRLDSTEDEEKVELLVEEFSGEFAGT